MAKLKYHNRVAGNKKYLDISLRLAAKMVEKREYEIAADYISSLANFAWHNCTGYYANWELEQLLNEIGGQLEDAGAAKDENNAGKLNILHVATELYNSGGHTKLLLNWVKNDVANNGKIVVSKQAMRDLPEKNILSSGLNMDCFISLEEQTSLIGKATYLRKLAKGYDCVVLHTHPDDVIPVIAFSSPNLPPIAFLNHADHIFWIGASISDLVLQIRAVNIKIDEVRRKLTNQFFLPIPVPDDTVETKYAQVRKELKVEEDTILLLSTGTEYKFVPTPQYNFFTHIIAVLDKHKNAVLYIAGISADSALATEYAHKQIVYLGEINDLYRYETACDIYVEGYPVPSFTALLQAGKKGKPVQLMYDPLPVVAFFDDHTPGFKYPTQDKWETELDLMISHIAHREKINEQQQEYFKTFYMNESWLTRLHEMYKILFGTRHKVYKHNSSQFYNTANENYLSALNYNNIPYPTDYKKKPIKLIYAYSWLRFVRNPIVSRALHFLKHLK
ncbi:MAG: hypothetical protein P4L41_11480 [Flavipsychrobacter sp.]|nr:hypothetical protein [Flavipsychrobacter sp.]